MKFNNPYEGRNGEKYSDKELINVMREMIATEMEATNIYQAVAELTDNEDAKKILLSVANEELVHVGEFEKVLYMISSEDQRLAEEGIKEAGDLIESGATEDEEETEKKTDAKEKPVMKLIRVTKSPTK